jgi:hypothetical protein
LVVGWLVVLFVCWLLLVHRLFVVASHVDICGLFGLVVVCLLPYRLLWVYLAVLF